MIVLEAIDDGLLEISGQLHIVKVNGFLLCLLRRFNWFAAKESILFDRR